MILIDILNKETSNTDAIYLYKEGENWCAYEHSAFLLYMLLFPEQIIKTLLQPSEQIIVKAEIKGEFVFPNLFPFGLVTVAEQNYMEIILHHNNFYKGFSQWKENIPLRVNNFRSFNLSVYNHC